MIEMPKELDERLHNWGQWCRPSKMKGSSWLAKYACDPEPTQPGARPVNIRDAEYVNARWRQMPFGAYEDRKVKLLVCYAYTYDVNAQTILRLIRRQHKVRILPSEYDDILEKGIRILGRKLGYVVN